MYTQADLDNFADAIIKNYTDWSNVNTPSLNNDAKVEFEYGKKYIRVVRSNHGQRSAHSFLEIATGNIWKAAGWKVPAKNKPRGNIANLTPNVTYWTGAV